MYHTSGLIDTVGTKCACWSRAAWSTKRKHHFSMGWRKQAKKGNNCPRSSQFSQVWPSLFFSSRSKIIAWFIIKDAPNKLGGDVKKEKHQVFSSFRNLSSFQLGRRDDGPKSSWCARSVEGCLFKMSSTRCENVVWSCTWLGGNAP